MHELLNQPAVQGGAAPFITALIVAMLLRRPRLSGLAAIAGFAVTVYLVSGFEFAPLTTTRKIVLLGLCSAPLAIALDWLQPRWLRPLLAAAAAAAVLWMSWRILQHQELALMLEWGAASALYAGWLVFWFDGLRHDPLRAGTAGLALGLGSGIAALFGASALLGLYGISLGAAAGAGLLIQMLSNRQLPYGRSFTLPLSLIAALTGILAVLSADLPWYALAALAAIPLASKIPLPAKPGLWLQAILLSVASLSCAAISVYLTWRVAGAPPL